MLGQRARYDTVTIWLHWLTAGLVITLWLEAQIIDFFGHAAEAYMRSLHITLGVTFALVVMFRVLWRLTAGRRPKVAENDPLERIAHATHYILYILAGGVVILGLLTVWMRGDSIWNLFVVPAYDPSNIRSLGRWMRGWHGTAANALLILAGLHAAAALFHHYLLRDDVLRRMLPP